MMLPKAYISHEVGRRLRLRVPEKKRDTAYFVGVREQLEGCEGIDEVRVNPLTASVLIRHHHLNPGTLKQYSREKKLFLVKSAPRAPERTWSGELSIRIDALDATLRDATGGRWDVPTVAGAVALVLGARQALEGPLLPPAWTLLSQALELWLSAERGAIRRR